MTSFFANPDDEVVLEFEDGVKLHLRKYADAGIQEDLDADMVKIKVRAENAKGKSSDGDDSTEAQVNMGNLRFIQLMTKMVELPDGKTLHAPIGMGTFRRMSREALAMTLDAVFENNPPLSRMRKLEEEALTE